MEHWVIETQSGQMVLTHYCTSARPNDTASILRQDLGGGYVRCERCSDKFLPPAEPGNPRLLFRLQTTAESKPAAVAEI